MFNAIVTSCFFERVLVNLIQYYKCCIHQKCFEKNPQIFLDFIFLLQLFIVISFVLTILCSHQTGLNP